MSRRPSPNVTPFIPPLPSPGGGLLARPPVSSDPPIPNPQVDNLPDWATEPQTAANFPTMYPGAGPQYTPYSSFTPHTPYNGTPYIPPLDDLNPPALAPATGPPGSYFPPPRTLPSQTPHHGVNGLSADYTGYPSGPQVPQVPQGPQGYPPGGQGYGGGPGGPQGFNGGFGGGGYGGGPFGPGTPWGGPPVPGAYPHTPYAQQPMMPPPTGYNQFQQPLPGGFGRGDWGPPVGYGPQPQPQHGYGMPGVPGGFGPTPWHGPGGLPPGGPPQRAGMGERMGAKLSEQWHRSDGWDLHDYDQIRFTPGPHYGPVLEPFLLRTVKAKLRMNPLLAPPDDNLKRPYIEWNMLFPTSTCHRSTDPRNRSWMQGRDHPATFPRVTLLRLVCRNLPWMITVRAGNRSAGVTCGEVIDSICENLARHVSKQEMASAPNQRAITETYWYNRSTAPEVPGGRLGDGVRRVDWLARHTAFGGIEENNELAREQCGGEVLPCTFELICEQKFAPDEELRERDSPRHEDHFSTRSTSSRSRSRGSPRVTIE